MALAASAKVNLYLHIQGIRSDGYHLLDSLVAFVDFSDTLSLKKSESISFEASGPFSHLLADKENNIMLKAANMLIDVSNRKGLGVHMSLEKNIPVGAGLGGGSADAASVVKGLLNLWELDLSEGEQASLALKLGADVPVCMLSKPAYVTGIGEHIEVASTIPSVPIVLVNCGDMVETPKVYQHYCGDFRKDYVDAIGHHDSQEFLMWLQAKYNDLQESALSLCPTIQQVLTAIGRTQDVKITRMSGSGATCFGLYAKQSQAEAAADQLKSFYPHWWVVATQVRGTFPFKDELQQ